MKTKTFSTALLFSLSLALAAAAQTAPKAPAAEPQSAAKPTPRTLNPAARSNLLAKTGGMIHSPVEGPSILFLNAQTRVAATVLDEPIELINKMLRLSTARKDASTTEPAQTARAALKDSHTAVVVVLCDSENDPSLLIAPESRWALVNVAALASADTSAETLTERTKKEVWRAFGYLMGTANSNFEACLMKSVLSPADLDALKGKSLSPEPFNKIMAHAQKLGMKPQRITTYRKAAEEGWAPAPTNDFQKAIWEDLKKK
jgi:hypothetical protein